MAYYSSGQAQESGVYLLKKLRIHSASPFLAAIKLREYTIRDLRCDEPKLKALFTPLV